MEGETKEICSSVMYDVIKDKVVHVMLERLILRSNDMCSNDVIDTM